MFTFQYHENITIAFKHSIFRLFFGDIANEYTNNPICVQTIRVIEDRSNLQKEVEAISKFDEVLTVNKPPEISAQSQDGTTMREIIETTIENKHELHPYIHDTFQCFIDNKTHLQIDIYQAVENIKHKFLLSLIIPVHKEIDS